MRIFCRVKLPLLIVAFLMSCNATPVSINDTNDVIISVDHSYSEIAKYEITWNQIFEIEKQDYCVYFYSLSCSHCEELKNFIIESAQKREDIFFVKSSSKDQITNDQKLSINAGNPGEIWILGYPSLIKISNKKCTKNLAGTTQILNELK